MNDPNALVFADGAYRLFAQYRDDAPEFKRTHWGRWSSPDLLAWAFDGVAIASEPEGEAYSGCVIRECDQLRAFHSLHDPIGLERQVTRTSADSGARWTAPEPILGPAQPNRRDPFVWRRADGSWRLLLARSGDWARADESATLELWASPDARDWREIGRIGPFSSPGVLWEVPLMIEDGAGRAALIVSTVDRRNGRADSAVRYWAGAFDGTAFVPEGESRPLDHGPDCYATMLHTPIHTANAKRLVVGWLSNWQTARAMPWPGFAGGPIGLPRAITFDERGLRQSPPAALLAAFDRCVGAVPHAGVAVAHAVGSWRIALASSCARLTVASDAAALRVERTGDPAFAYAATHPVLGQSIQRNTAHRLTLFVDGPAVELFIDDEAVVSAALPTDGAPFAVHLEDATGNVALRWRTLPPAR